MSPHTYTPFFLFSSFNIGNSTSNFFCFSIYRDRKLTILKGSHTLLYRHLFGSIPYANKLKFPTSYLYPLALLILLNLLKFSSMFVYLVISCLSWWCCLTRESMFVPSALSSVICLPHPGSLSRVCQCSLPYGGQN